MNLAESISMQRKWLDRRKAERDLMEKDLSAFKQESRKLKEKVKNLGLAKAVLQKAAKKTQEELEFRISGLVTMALNAVLENPYEFNLRFEEKRGKTEASLMFTRDGKETDPVEEESGGSVDVASFALRTALWSLHRPMIRNVLLLDEPFKWLHGNHHHKVIQLLREISHKLGLQIIVVTYSNEMVDGADRVFRVRLSNKQSIVTEERRDG